MTTQALAIRPAGAQPAQLSAYSALLNATFATDKFNVPALAWRYRDNPAGQVVGADAWDGERLAAHYVACPLEARIDGRVVRGLVSLNTATHPDYQGRGLFTKLAEAAYALGAAAGYSFVIGVANANSTPGFLRRLAFQDVGRLHAGVLARLPSGFSEAPVQVASGRLAAGAAGLAPGQSRRPLCRRPAPGPDLRLGQDLPAVRPLRALLPARRGPGDRHSWNSAGGDPVHRPGAAHGVGPPGLPARARAPAPLAVEPHLAEDRTPGA